MQELYKLKEMLCKELEEYGAKGEMSGGTLEVVDKLAHALKNLDRIIEVKEMSEGESEASYRGGSYRGGGSYAGGGSYRGGSYSREGGNSYARGRGRNARRDSMGRYSSMGYSREGDNEQAVQQLEEMMQEVPPEAQQHIQKAIQAMMQ